MESTKNKILLNFRPEVIVLTSECECLTHDFNCGTYAFNEYIIKTALEDKQDGSGVTYLVLDKKIDNTYSLVAYYTISTSTVHFIDEYDFDDDNVPTEEKRKHYSPISSFTIDKFAVDKSYQKCLFNNELVSNLVLQNVINELIQMSTNIIAAKIIILCSVPYAVKFYGDNEFEKFDKSLTLFDHIDAKDNIPMYLPIHKINILEY